MYFSQFSEVVSFFQICQCIFPNLENIFELFYQNEMRTFLRFHLYFYGFSDYFSEFQVFFQKLHILPNIIFLEFWSIFPNHQYFSWFFRSNGIFFRFIYFYLTYNFFFWSIFLDFQYFSDRCPKKGGNWVPGAFFLTDYGWTSLNFDWTDWVSIRAVHKKQILEFWH